MQKVVINVARTDKGYSGNCDLLPSWIVATDGDFSQFCDYVRESIDFYIECAKEDGEKYPSVFDKEYELVYLFDVQSILHYLRGIMTFAALERITGIDQKQLAHYAAGRSQPRKEQAVKIGERLHQFASELSSVTCF